ncbi:hypothetical protein MESS4_280050 [Mesorhizobium sp. STM 4661]|nr:hypothetical protein MESS4_280050 [Mesorhizobium sp. STM 4661]
MMRKFMKIIAKSAEIRVAPCGQDYGAIAPYQSARPAGTMSAFDFRPSSYGREQRPPARDSVKFYPNGPCFGDGTGHDILWPHATRSRPDFLF